MKLSKILLKTESFQFPQKKLLKNKKIKINNFSQFEKTRKNANNCFQKILNKMKKLTSDIGFYITDEGINMKNFLKYNLDSKNEQKINCSCCLYSKFTYSIHENKPK